MKGDFQSWFHHEIPKEPSVLGERICSPSVVTTSWRSASYGSARAILRPSSVPRMQRRRVSRVRADLAKVQAERATLKRSREEQGEE